MRRRDFATALGGSVLVSLLAGCERESVPTTHTPSGWSVRFRERPLTKQADLLLEYETERDRTVAEQIVDNGTRSYQWAPRALPEVATDQSGPYLRENGSYYAIRVTEHETKEVTGYEFSIKYSDDWTPSDNGPVVPYEALSAPDRAALHYAVHLYYEAEDNDYSGFSGSFRYPYTVADAADSTFVGRETVWVRYDGEYYRLRKKEEVYVDVVANTYRAERVAANRSTWIAYVRENHAFTLTLESGQARDAAEQAIQGTYRSSELVGDPLVQAIVRQSPSDADVVSAPRKSYFLQYRGTYFEVLIIPR